MSDFGELAKLTGLALGATALVCGAMLAICLAAGAATGLLFGGIGWGFCLLVSFC